MVAATSVTGQADVPAAPGGFVRALDTSQIPLTDLFLTGLTVREQRRCSSNKRRKKCSQQVLEEMRTERCTGARTDRNRRGVDSHLESRRDPRSPPSVLP